MIGSDNALARGALAGAVGTAVMTLMMRKVAPRVIPDDMRPDEFVPKKAVERAEEVAGIPHALSKEREMQVAMGTHFAYGSSMGALYGKLRERVLADVPAPVAGALFGFGVWAVGFEGLLPAAGVQPATTDMPKKKWPLPVMAHLVYGATTALTYERLR